MLAPSRARLEGRWRRLRYRSRKPRPWEGFILQREAWGRRRAVAAGKSDEAPVAPFTAASRLRPAIAQSVACGEKLPPASAPALPPHPRWARHDPRKRLLAALRELARDCDLDGVGLAAALLGRFGSSAARSDDHNRRFQIPNSGPKSLCDANNSGNSGAGQGFSDGLKPALPRPE